MAVLLIICAILAFVCWRIVATNGDFDPQDYDEQTVHYIQPYKGNSI